MRQIHQLTQVLARVIAAVVGFKNPEKADQEIEISNQALNEQLDLNINDLLTWRQKKCSVSWKNIRG